jgi:CheY-like chemotaxis protein
LTYIDRQVTFALSPLIRGISLARKILLADDSVTAQNMGRKILADAGYEVIAVNNGSAALKKIAELKPDLVILDVYMPGYSGLEVCQRLKESQETARIPVLLSVGKLEPFKPEEAQRVRADGFIVKPFEASELLSALSKLEDKVVPRAEPSKPGRFARAIAAAEESSRGTEDKSERSGWKSRIGFPHEKAEPAEKVAGESSIYNAMNRDLRTVVETPAEKAAEKAVKKEETPEAGEAAKTSVAALAPAGLPKDVTPEEVAAIAAAAAQIQMAGATSGEARTHDAVESNFPAPPGVQRESTLVSPGAAEALRETKDESSNHAAAETVRPQDVSEKVPEKVSEETDDEPVTMAAGTESVAAGGGSRWTAVAVPLEGDEATVILDQEMRKAYAAFAAAVADSDAAASAREAPSASVEQVPIQPEAAAVEVPVAAIPFIYSEPVPAPEHAVSSDVATPNFAAASNLAAPNLAAPNFADEERASRPEFASSSSQQSEVGVPAPARAEFSPQETSAGTSATPTFTEPKREPTPVEFMSPVSEAEVAGLAGIVGLSADRQLALEAKGATDEAASVSSRSFTPGVEAADPSRESAAQPAAELPAAELKDEPRPDPETVKSTAAAWESWRQGRDNGKSSESEVALGQLQEPAVAESAPADTAARAVAAGAEQIAQEVPGTAPSGNPGDVASIVDSVLADLRPKLMAEISRKMSQKK